MAPFEIRVKVHYLAGGSGGGVVIRGMGLVWVLGPAFTGLLDRKAGLKATEAHQLCLGLRVQGLGFRV